MSGREFLVMLAPSFYRMIMRHIITVDPGGVASARAIEPNIVHFLVLFRPFQYILQPASEEYCTLQCVAPLDQPAIIRRVSTTSLQFMLQAIGRQTMKLILLCLYGRQKGRPIFYRYCVPGVPEPHVHTVRDGVYLFFLVCQTVRELQLVLIQLLVEQYKRAHQRGGREGRIQWLCLC